MILPAVNGGKYDLANYLSDVGHPVQGDFMSHDRTAHTVLSRGSRLHKLADVLLKTGHAKSGAIHKVWGGKRLLYRDTAGNIHAFHQRDE